MHKTAREAMKEVIIGLLNKSLSNQGLEDMTVVYLSDDFETAKVRAIDGTTVIVKSEIMLPLTEDENYENKTQTNRGVNAGDVERVRAQRIRRQEGV